MQRSKNKHWFTAEGLNNLKAEVIAKAKAELDKQVIEITDGEYDENGDELGTALKGLKQSGTRM